MAHFERLIRFEAQGSHAIYFSDLGVSNNDVPVPGTEVQAYEKVEDIVAGVNKTTKVIGKILAPVPTDGIPIYCVGLNYRTHAEEAKLPIPSNPPVWLKPAAALANPNEDIPMNKFCASSFPDYEGELVFITSKNCRDVSIQEANSYIFGYTIGNDLSCRLHQLPEQGGGQFTFAKAFDKFAPLGPALISPAVFEDGKGLALTTRVNGEVLQKSEFMAEFIWSPAQILSHISQGTTIPAGTAVMTGTPAGVGAFQKPRRQLNSGDEVEIEISKIGVLKNKIVFI